MFAGKLTLDGEYEVADTMCDFAQMIRYNTTASSTMLPLREELNHVRNYVSLQRCRYGNSVVLRVHAAEALLNLPIPRFLLQPIVENSFEHGFAGKAPDAERLIVVSARKVGKRLILRVRDNGQGMEPGQVEAMNRKFAQPYDALACTMRRSTGLGWRTSTTGCAYFPAPMTGWCCEAEGGGIPACLFYWASKSESRCGSLCLWVDSSKQISQKRASPLLR